MATIEQLRQAVPQSVQKLNPHIFGVVRSEEAVPYKTQRETTEAELQASFEQWLLDRGYGRRTPKQMQGHTTTRWMVHLAQPRGNPVLLDVLLLWHWPEDPPGHTEALEIELKVAGGVLSPDQRHLVLTGSGAVAWSLSQAQEAVRLWETAVRGRHHA